MPNNDLEIIESCLLGNKQEFALLVDKYKNMVYQLALRMSGNYHDSEDIAQEAFIKAFHSLRHYNPSFRFSTWLYRITLNIIRDRIKKKGLKTQPLEQNQGEQKWHHQKIHQSAGDNNPENKITRQEDRQDLQTAILSLSVSHREIIILRHIQNLSYHEIARILNISLNTVKVRLHRSRRELKKILQKK
mgnify:CR=1 FL=1